VSNYRNSVETLKNKKKECNSGIALQQGGEGEKMRSGSWRVSQKGLDTRLLNESTMLPGCGKNEKPKQRPSLIGSSESQSAEAVVGTLGKDVARLGAVTTAEVASMKGALVLSKVSWVR